MSLGPTSDVTDSCLYSHKSSHKSFESESSKTFLDRVITSSSQSGATRTCFVNSNQMKINIFSIFCYFTTKWCQRAAGLSPECCSRGCQKPEGGAKNQKEGHIFKMQYWMHTATGGPNVKWGGTDFKWGGPGTTLPLAGDGPEEQQNGA